MARGQQLETRIGQDLPGRDRGHHSGHVPDADIEPDHLDHLVVASTDPEKTTRRKHVGSGGQRPGPISEAGPSNSVSGKVTSSWCQSR